MIAHTERGGRIRIISARDLIRAERDAYENEIDQEDCRQGMIGGVR